MKNRPFSSRNVAEIKNLRKSTLFSHKCRGIFIDLLVYVSNTANLQFTALRNLPRNRPISKKYRKILKYAFYREIHLFAAKFNFLPQNSTFYREIRHFYREICHYHFTKSVKICHDKCRPLLRMVLDMIF